MPNPFCSKRLADCSVWLQMFAQIHYSAQSRNHKNCRKHRDVLIDELLSGVTACEPAMYLKEQSAEDGARVLNYNGLRMRILTVREIRMS
jgi:hypothetical protein